MAKLKGAPKAAAKPGLVARAEALLRRAEAAAGSYTNAGDQFYFEGYLQEPTQLLALRHESATTLEVLAHTARQTGPLFQ